MRRRIWIRYEDQVEVDLGREEFREWVGELVVDDAGETYRTLAAALVRVYAFIRDLPDAALAEIPDAARETLSGALRRLADRLETGAEVKP